MDASQTGMEDSQGVSVDADHLLKLRHLVYNLPEKRLAPSGLPGGFVSRRRGRGLEMVDIRVFSEGDDIRHLDHNATARTGIPHARTFREEKERRVLLLADFRPSMLWGTRRVFRSVAAAEALALAGWRAIAAGGRVGLLVFGAREPVFVPARGRDKGMIAVVGGLVQAHRAALATAMDAKAADEQSLESGLELAVRMAPTGSSVFLASGLDRPGESFDSLALALNRRNQLTMLLIKDAFEQRPPAGSYPFVTTSGRIGWISLSAKHFSSEPDPRLNHLAELGIDTIPLDAEGGPEAMAVELERFDGPRR